jgi:hypothetical protein
MTVRLVSLQATLAPSADASKPNFARGIKVVGYADLPDAAVAAYATYVTDAAAYVTAAATFATALGVLVADGASPTQAHVTTANTAYTALAAAYTTLAADWTALKAVIDGQVTSSGHALTVVADVTDFKSSGLIRATFDKMLKQFAADSLIAN